MLRKFIALLLCLSLFAGLAGCGSSHAEGSGHAAEATEVTEPAPTIPADGDPNDVTCKGSYYAGNETIDPDTVIATAGDGELTLGLLHIYYWLEVAAHRISTEACQPDYSQSLDTQHCPLDDSVNSWQQYFLRNALSAWHTQQALVQLSRGETLPMDDYYAPDLEKHAEYMTGMPATQYLYSEETYQPNRLHQAYLDSIPDTLSTLSADSGFGNDYQAMAAAIASPAASGGDLETYTELLNRAYMYFTEMGYHLEYTQEEIDACAETVDAAGYTVNIRHILLIPENAETAADGTVTASEEDWDRCRVQAQSLVSKWNEEIRTTRYSQYAGDRIPEARFSEIAKNYSQDSGTAANGGLYVQLEPGQLLPELDAWCFDEARAAGDCEILRSDAGYHIIFFSGANDNRRTEGESRLTLSAYLSLASNAREQYPCTVDYSAILLGEAEDNGSFITPSDLLYPDVAHERFPDMPLYLQQDFPDAPFGNYTVSSHGCGITTLAMVASYLTDDELTPAELAGRYGYYCGERGSEIVIFDDTPAEMGFHLQNRSYSWAEMDEALENGQVVVSLQYYGYWTRGGHYLAMIDLTEDGKYVVRDSNLINYKRILRHAEDSHTRGSISEAGQYYWIYEPKVVSIPACARCGNEETGILLSGYTCEKCLNALERRNDFLLIS